MKKIAAFIVALIPISACYWDSELYDAVVNEDVVEFCPDDGWPGELRYIEIDDKKCYRYDEKETLPIPKDALICKNENDCCGFDRDKARKYILAFNRNICPAKFMCHIPETDAEDDVHHCFYSGKCVRGFHLSADGTKCEEDTSKACGSFNNNCLDKKGMEEADCIYGACNAIVCDKQHHREKVSANTYRCVANTVEACPVYDEDGNVAYEEDGSIRMKSCTPGEGQASVICTERGCRAESCQEGYHLDEHETTCVPNSFKECGAWYTDCHINGMKSGECKLSNGEYKCVAMTCEDGYTPVNGECFPNNNNHCGLDANHNVIECKNGEICDAIETQCVNVCPGGITRCDDVCVDTNTSSYHCGQCNNACPNGICQNGQCTCVSSRADCDNITGCETNLNEKNLKDCKNCKDGYYDANDNLLDGCELKLSDYGLSVSNGNLVCMNSNKENYKPCGDYTFTLNGKTITIPLCLKYNNNGQLKDEDSCKKLCNSNVIYVVGTKSYLVKKCNPTQKCFLGKENNNGQISVVCGL